MQRQVIIFSAPEDVHASALKWALEKNGIQAVWGPSLRLDTKAIYAAPASKAGVEVFGNRWSADAAATVWMRRVETPTAQDVHEEDREFAAMQWKMFQKNVFDAADHFANTFWVNRPAAGDMAESKLVQLRAARDVSIPFPDTVIGNDAAAVSELLQKHEKLVFKQFTGHMWKSKATGEMHSCGPALLTKDHDLPPNSIAVCPGIYQQYIDKIFDLRVTVIGDRIFTIRLRRKDGTAYLDWRPHIYDEDMEVESFTLSASIEHKLRAFMSKLGLVYGAIDLVADRNGELYLLEINQQGQFLFVEEAVNDLPVLRAMTSMFMQGSAQYDLDASVELSFADYMKSDEYARVTNIPVNAEEFFTSEV